MIDRETWQASGWEGWATATRHSMYRRLGFEIELWRDDITPSWGICVVVKVIVAAAGVSHIRRVPE